VAIFAERFHYFCDLSCRERYLTQHPELLRVRSRAGGPDSDRDSVQAFLPPLSPLGTESADPGDQVDGDVELLNVDEVAALEVEVASPRSDVGALLLLSATVAGVLAIALALTGSGTLALTIRLVIACFGAGLLVVRSILTPRDPADPHSAAILGPALAAGVIAIWARILGHEIANEAAILTGLIVVSTGTSIQLVEQVRRGPAALLASIEQALDAPARRVLPSGYAIVGSSSLRPGEEVLIDAGEMVPTDVMISAGEATVLPWLGGRSATSKRPGESLVAGSRVVTGRLRATVSWSGLDRAWLRTTSDPHRAAHVLAPVARHGRMVVERWALASGALAGLATFANGASTPYVLLAAVAAHAAVASVATGATPSIHVLRGVVGALGRGVAYQSASAWDRAAQVTVAVFSARGTLLLGEPQVAEIVGLGRSSSDRLLGLAAGAEAIAEDPIAAAVKRAAQDREVAIDAVRSPNVVPGLGVTAVTSTGESLCVGSRALMLREHISMATLEGRLAELESMGRTVLLVSVASKLIGFIALQDGLRPGARAAVQHLLDAGVEPVLMSGDARETCEAIARSLDIEHVRPEVLPADRGQEIRSMAESGATVAVVGRAAQDSTALEAADVGVALESAGSTLGDWAVNLAGDDVRDAARALVSARRSRMHARMSIVIGLAPGIASGLAIAFGLLPPAYAPLAVLISSVGTHLHLRAVEPTGRDGGVG
jgi:cation transport ATPase